MSKKIFRYARWFTIAFLSFLTVYFTTAYCLSSVTINPKPDNRKEIAIYIMSNGVHTDIVVPAISAQKNWTEEIKYSNTLKADSSFRYLAIGWGDKKFYLETPEFSDLKITTAIGAISGLNSSAMHTSYYRNIREDRLCKKIMISEMQYHKLIKYIINSFRSNEKGNFIKVNTNIHYDTGDAFYEANGSYSIFKTCNTWTNNALKACDQKCCLWTIFDTPILDKYE